MDILYESIGLGVDLVILGLCLRQYVNYKHSGNMLKSAVQLPIDGDLSRTLEKQQDKKIPYAVIRGTVTPIGQPIRSSLVPGVSGVLQIVKLTEHRFTRGFAGFWTDNLKVLHESSNLVPFDLRNQAHGVEIVDALRAEVLDVDVIYDNYEPATLTLWDHLFGFISGIRQRGLQTSEAVLREGSVLTAIGELELDGKVLRMQPSQDGSLILTTATKATLIQRVEEGKSALIFRMVFYGSISIVLLGLIARKLYLKRKQQRAEADVRNRLEEKRRERRALMRPQNLSEDQRCVVCSANPKEIIILPCGHVCLCEDCSQHISNSCPVCRGKIDSKSAAFIV
ncbi:mitochondrial E3 ubiquitin protein ligase 1-like [Drosophila tropicalis]|uniref:mitochondrial E3 ubiquitin protein ligase 1-like n=1 Tax=Drosophila tropicalis TaxID=46794 RepID=UPI0035ABA0D4